MDYWLTQPLTNHGFFGAYLHRFDKLETAKCWFCGFHADDAFHTFFQCEAWETQRRCAETDIGGSLTPDMLAEYMLRDNRAWSSISGFIQKVLKKKTEKQAR